MADLKKEIHQFVEKYFRIYFLERDFEKIKTLLSSEMTVIGTGLHEIGKNAKETLQLYEKDISEVTSPIKYSNLNINIHTLNQHFSVVSGDFSINGESDGIKFSIPNLRYSLTIRKEKGVWKIIHLHISTPNEQQKDNELYPLQKLIEHNELLNKKVEERTKELLEVNQSLLKSIQTKDKLLSIISHDIRSPFNGLLGFSDLLAERYDEYDSSKHKHFIKLIKESSHKIYDLVDSLLLWSNSQRHTLEFNPTKLHLRELATNCSDIFNQSLLSKNISLLNNINEEIIVHADEFMISTIFRNLISNSLKFTKPGGQINISAFKESEGKITICIEDTGVGMTEEQINKIFESDINTSTEGTNKEKGSGLGLSVCKEFIECHSSKLWIESTTSMGSRFFFNLQTC
ncbi:MAG: hypothetical protein C0598_06845 [Marinilabiliales bacterium]|nr:MAG: hypothetical protein C0598_06845 [Marinilabiliales bacterium]